MVGLLLIGEFAIYAVLPAPSTAAEYFAIFAERPLMGLLTFDLLGIIAYLFFVPTVLALYAALRRHDPAWSAVASVLFFLGIADFFSTNTGFPMLALSNQYALAQTAAERQMLLASGQTMLTIFNDNAFLVSYVIVSASWVIMSAVMLRSVVFGRFTAIAGILAGSTGILAVMLEHITFVDALGLAIAFYFLAIVFLFIWVLLIAGRLRRLGAPGVPSSN